MALTKATYFMIDTAPINVQDYGATGDGSTDDQAAFAAAITAGAGKTIYVPNPTVSYKIGTGTLTLPANTILAGETNKVTKLDHAFNGTMFVLGDGAGLVNLYLNGDGANYTGVCIDLQSTAGRQVIQGVRASDWEGIILQFALGAGSQSAIYDCRFERRNAGTGTNRYAVVISATQQLSAVPRKFALLDTGGTCSFDFGGCNNVYVSDSFLADLKYTADSRGVLISNSRIANQTSLTLDGHNNTFSGCDISPALTLASNTDAWSLQGSVFNNLPITDSSGNNRNILSHYPIAYTPTITSGGTAPSLGDGTIAGYASRNGSIVNVNIVFTVGSTTTLGTGDLRFSLPSWAPNSNGYIQVCGTALLYDGATYYTGVVQIPNSQQYARIFRDTSGPVIATSPATWNTGDTFVLNFAYEV
jgi:hypothetical protein